MNETLINTETIFLLPWSKGGKSVRKNLHWSWRLTSRTAVMQKMLLMLTKEMQGVHFSSLTFEVRGRNKGWKCETKLARLGLRCQVVWVRVLERECVCWNMSSSMSACVGGWDKSESVDVHQRECLCVNESEREKLHQERDNSVNYFSERVSIMNQFIRVHFYLLNHT